MKKKYFTPEMEEMEVESLSLLEATNETGQDEVCTSHVPTCSDNWA